MRTETTRDVTRHTTPSYDDGAGGATSGPGEHLNYRVLVADDQPDIHRDFDEMLLPRATATSRALAEAFLPERQTLHSLLPRLELLHARGGEEACNVVEGAKRIGRPIALAYIDIRMPPGIDGVEAAHRIRKIDAEIEIVLMTAYTDTPLPQIVRDMDLLHKLLYIRKPFAREEVQQITLSLIEKWNVERELSIRRRDLLATTRRLESVLDATGEAMAMYDVAGRLVFANRWYSLLLTGTDTDLVGKESGALSRLCDERFEEALLGDAGARLFAYTDGTVVQPAAAGHALKDRLFYRSVRPVQDHDGNVTGDLYVYRDVSKEIEIEQMREEVTRLRARVASGNSFAGMVGASPGMQQVYALMERAVDNDITVIIRGESGTGKELVAKSLHFHGERKQGPFVALNCAGVPETLIESELFGHEQGAFTGAARRRIGCFERADGGTLLLDEIGDMPPALQAKLLRVLQEREVQRVGGSASIPVDVRVIAATNMDLEAAMAAGTFREDLYYRIAGFPLVVPPLRERREDIPLLVDHFLDKYAAARSKSIGGIATAALRHLLHYDWPGNVRELESAIERAVLLETTSVLQSDNLPPRVLEAFAAHDAMQAPDAPQVLPLEEVERRAIHRALSACSNNVTRAARALGIDRVTLHRKLKKYALAGG